MYAERIVPVHKPSRTLWVRDLWARKPWQRVRLPGLFRLVLRHPRDAAGIVVGLGVIGAIIANSLFLQPGPHPSPIFAIRPLPVMAREETGTVAQSLRPRPIAGLKADGLAPADPVPLPRPRAQVATAGTHPDPIADLINPKRQSGAAQRVPSTRTPARESNGSNATAPSP